MTAGPLTAPTAAIVDYGLGNLFSIEHACRAVGIEARITSDRRQVATADAIILPGVGAFGDAMATLHRLDLVSVLCDVAAAGRPLIGICLGIQLLMRESCELGRHRGLGLIEGDVVPIGSPQAQGRRLKVPHVGWNTIHDPRRSPPSWSETMLSGVMDGEFMYFVHSYIVRPENPDLVLATTRYGDVEFCSALHRGSIFACQFHPERSGHCGVSVYSNLRTWLAAAPVHRA